MERDPSTINYKIPGPIPGIVEETLKKEDFQDDHHLSNLELKTSVTKYTYFTKHMMQIT